MRLTPTIAIVVSLLFLPALSFSQSSSPSWYTLNAVEGSALTSSSTITLRYGQVASKCASTAVTSGVCMTGAVGTPTPEAWTAAKTFTAPVNITVGTAAFNNVDPMPGVYKTVQIQQTKTSQTVAINGKSVTVPAASTCSLTSAPSSIAFRDTTVGYTLASSATLSSSCTLTITSVKVTGPYTLTGITTPLQMSSGKTQAYTVTFAPQVAGATTGSIAFTGDGITAPSLTVSLSGNGVSPASALVASASSLAFGNIILNSSSSQVLTITNSGSSSVTVSGLAISGTGFSYSYVAAPFTLASKQARQITVTFKPTSAGAASGRLTITSNASNPSLGVALSGTGAAAATSHYVSLTWTGSSGVSGYNIYRSTTSGTGYTKISSLNTSTSFTDRSVTAGTTYYYAATAVASNGAESSYSNQATVKIPSP
jgi:hypothetical protein